MVRKEMSPSWLERYLEGSRQLSAALLLCVPLLVVYEAGLLLLARGRVRNLADGVLKAAVYELHPRALLLINGLLLVVFCWFALRRRSRDGAISYLAPLLIESAFYACFLVPLGKLAERLTLLGLGLGRSDLLSMVLGVGAGLYEEILFRLLLLPVLVVVFHRVLSLDPFWAVVWGIIVSSLGFSAYHHLGASGESYEASVFVFRFFAGVFLGVVFSLRGFAVAAWTHVLYDEFCLWGGS